MLYEVLYGAASSVVFPIGLEKCGAEHYGQVMEIHLVQIRKTLHAETHAGKNRHKRKHIHWNNVEKCVVQCMCFSPVEVIDKGL